MSDDNSIKIWRAFVETWKLWKRSVDSNFSSVNLDSTSYSVLRNLAENGPTTMVRMAALTNVTQGWITGIIDNLEEQGLVVRRRSREDRRKKSLNPLISSIISRFQQMPSRSLWNCHHSFPASCFCLDFLGDLFFIRLVNRSIRVPP